MLKMRKGFTLIELLIVVVIIGILAAIAIPKFANTKQKAYITAMKSDLRNLVTAEEAYFADSSQYTGTVGNLKFQSTNSVSSPVITTGTCPALQKESRSASRLILTVRERGARTASTGKPGSPFVAPGNDATEAGSSRSHLQAR